MALELFVSTSMSRGLSETGIPRGSKQVTCQLKIDNIQGWVHLGKTGLKQLSKQVQCKYVLGLQFLSEQGAYTMKGVPVQEHDAYTHI